MLPIFEHVGKYLDNFEMWCWRRMEKISWTDRVRNEMLHRDREERIVFAKTGTSHSTYICYFFSHAFAMHPGATILSTYSIT